MESGHQPVLLRQCIEGLCIRADGIYVDGTLGRAGHALEIAKRLKTGRIIGIDRDPTAIREAGIRLAPYKINVTLIHGNFQDMGELLEELGISQVDGMLFDLGVSSPQLDVAERGFSYTADAPLDMRMDQTQGKTAYEVVNDWPEDRLKRILYEYGEERYAPGIARCIVRARERQPVRTTLELVEIIKKGMPPSALREKQHPAKRSFQAIRIAVNDELGAVSRLVENAVPKLKKGGRLAVISFHSLEDRLIKNAIAAHEKGCTCPKDFPICVCGFTPTLRTVSRKAIMPEKEEVARNPRARSAKLRIAQRI